MHDSPRIRRLRNDLAALERLQSESSVFRFKAHGKPPNHFLIHMKGKSLYRVRSQVYAHNDHRIEIKLGASYPRTIPEIRWITPIYHPNISEIGMVCLGGYGTHWVPSVQLDELCNMLWDMARYHNYDIRSPYNRDAALWVASQTTFLFPTDARPLRDLRAAMGRVESASNSEPGRKHAEPSDCRNGSSSATSVHRENGERAPARVLEFVRRYGALLSKAPEPPVRRVAAIADVDGPSAGLLPLAAPPLPRAPLVPLEEEEEIVLLESASPSAPLFDAPRELDDGITFID